MDISGKSCTYGVTLVKNAPNREAAISFLVYMLDPKGGLQVLKDMGQPPFVPCRVPSKDALSKIPTELQPFAAVSD